MDEDSKLSRKTVLRAALAAGVAAPVALIGGPALARTTVAGGQVPELTPACHDGDEPTIEQTEGPYFKPNSPERTDLVTPGTPGTRLTVSGYVFGRACLPISRVLLDFWQADVNGAYDNTGYTFRGHQYTDAQGAFRLSTIVPGLYPGRTRHIHVKVQAPGRPILTTQLYFPNEPRNNTDTIFDARLLMTVRDNGSAKEGAFDFVLNVPQTPTSTSNPPTSNPPTSTPPGGTTWAVGTSYAAGARVTYGGQGYVCLQGHTAQPGWEPPAVPALWRAG
ncbi:Protocatechuate 3,4-dioxygenase beta subunit [Amycolatopsis pretoriensis]|uniref:Protocatechuate 3,4-dioxygenase beta subunit n=1 Tax=Amycolatopsis pretoriensis TaxID=218821 RepID=A0A1H5QMH4_9PSEU|nr:carbohydrate-binding protein [Amycolatopsis pretoriensis]SEF27279.1 Protocatechuate 3,4-dioxygenase beta subunit [Amycolatopsis pretoriensis]